MYICILSFDFKEGFKSMTRREAREQSFILIFEKSFHEDTQLSELIEFAQENDVFKPDSYSVTLCENTVSNIEKIDSLITENLKGWSYSRVSKVAKALLRMAVSEMLYSEDVPVGAAINEAVELAKKYASDDEPSFINGILGSVAKGL